MGLQPGTVLRGRYEITRIIKSGGMGSVCEAIDNNLAKSPCAIKEILESALSGPDAEYIQATFENEMKALVNLDHPGIPKVRDYFHEGDRRYIVMDYVKGQSLEDEIRDYVELNSTGLLPGKVVNDILTLLEIVEYLHKLSPPILHRDIKPANIIRDERTGRIKLVDFGLAKALNETFSPQTMVGTMGYCPPEQLSGKVERRSDLYAVGATLYHMLTGKVPQLSFDPLVLNMPQLRPGLDEIVNRATQVRVNDRYATASDLASDLRTWQADLSGTQPSKVVVRPVAVDPYPFPNNDPNSTVVSNTSSNQWAWATVAVAALGLGVLCGKLVLQPSSAATPVPLASSSIVSSPTPEKLASKPVSPVPTATPSQNVQRIPAHQPPLRRNPPTLPPVPAPPHSDPGPPESKVPRTDGDPSYPVSNPVTPANDPVVVNTPQPLPNNPGPRRIQQKLQHLQERIPSHQIPRPPTNHRRPNWRTHR
jgi:eukaryotic-like serine/threonine-protein kinase